MKEGERITGSRILMILLRIVAVLMAVFLFVPALNPARISGVMNSNEAFFTSGFVYSSISSGFKRAINKGWVSESTLKLVFYSSLIGVISYIVCAIGGAITMGEAKLKKLSVKIMFGASITAILSCIGIYIGYTQLLQSSNLKKVDPQFPNGLVALAVLAVLCMVLSLILMIKLPKPAAGEKYYMQPKYYLFLLALPFIVLCFVFSYLPLWGWRFSFFDYKSGLGLSSDNFVGFKWFTYLFENAATRKDIIRVLKNTLAMSGLGIATSWVSMAFAIFLSEIKATRYRKIVQTCTTVPNFISWVLVYAFAFAIFSTDGFMNEALTKLGVLSQPINYLISSEHIWIKMLAWGLWKGLGWGAIIYLAAISGIDQQLYEAATVDGAGRFQKIWNITVPGLMATYFVLLMLSIAGILSNGMDQYYVFKNSNNKNTIEVLDLYVYTLGLGSGGSSNIALATVVGMLKSIVSVILLFFANGLSKLIRKESII